VQELCILTRVLTALVTILVSSVAADDWPQWRGPRRDGISREKLNLAAWSEGGAPRVAWRASVGKGHSAVAVSGGRAYTMGWDGSRDTVFCLDAATGKTLWQQSYECRTIVQWPGPRTTPTVADGVVYTLGQWGQLRAWDAATGKAGWAVQLDERFNPDIDYGFASSPLVVDDLLILGYGRRGLAVRAKDGSFAWGNDGQRGACTSPVPYEHEGRRGIVVLHTNAERTAVELVGVDPPSGRELWRSPPWKESWGAACVDPLVHGGRVFITTGEQHRRAARFTIAGATLREDWSTNRLAGYTGGCVLLDGHLYTVDGGGILKCLAWETGQVKWQQRGFDERGSLIAVDGKLLIQTGKQGDLVMAAADAAKYQELRRGKVFAGDGATFTAPVYSNGRVCCRSYEGEVACVALQAEE
jgi:outer membrane protein assembly factor BamB